VELLGHKNEWFVRTARRLLHERSLVREISENAQQRLLELAGFPGDPVRRLRAIWTLHAVGRLTDEIAARTLRDSDEYVRGWTVQLLAERRNVSRGRLWNLVQLAKFDPSRRAVVPYFGRSARSQRHRVAIARSAHWTPTGRRRPQPAILALDGLARRLSAAAEPTWERGRPTTNLFPMAAARAGRGRLGSCL
jgi:hypothetical protein